MKLNFTGENAMAKAKGKNRFYSLSVYSRGVVACVVFFSLIVLVLFPFRCSIVSQLLVRISSDRELRPDVASICLYFTLGCTLSVDFRVIETTENMNGAQSVKHTTHKERKSVYV